MGTIAIATMNNLIVQLFKKFVQKTNIYFHYSSSVLVVGKALSAAILSLLLNFFYTTGIVRRSDY